VSLNGSPTVSPVTAAWCASLPLPPKCPRSMCFFALSHAPPPVFSTNASSIPAIVPTIKYAATASAFKITPTSTVTTTTNNPGSIISLSAAFVQMSTQRA